MRVLVVGAFCAFSFANIAPADSYVVINNRQYLVRGRSVRVYNDPRTGMLVIVSDGRIVYDNRSTIHTLPPAPAPATPMPVRRAEPVYPRAEPVYPRAEPVYPRAEPVHPETLSPPNANPTPTPPATPAPQPTPRPVIQPPVAAKPPPAPNPEEIARHLASERELIEKFESNHECPIPEEILSELDERKKHPLLPSTSPPLNDRERLEFAQVMASNAGITYYLWLKVADPEALRTLSSSSATVRKVHALLRKGIAISLWRSAKVASLLEFEGAKNKKFSDDTLDLLRHLSGVAFRKLCERAEHPDKF